MTQKEIDKLVKHARQHGGRMPSVGAKSPPQNLSWKEAKYIEQTVQTINVENFLSDNYNPHRNSIADLACFLRTAIANYAIDNNRISPHVIKHVEKPKILDNRFLTYLPNMTSDFTVK